MFEMDRTAGIMILDSEGFLRSALKPTLYTNADQSIGHVEVNMSNLEFEPAKLPRKLLQHGIAMGPMGSTPGWATAVGTTKIPANIISGKPWDGGTLADTAEYVLFAYPLGVSIGPGKEHVEGRASSRETQDWVESEYNVQTKEWVMTMVSVTDNFATIQQVLHAIDGLAASTLKEYMGGGAEFDNLDLIGRNQFPTCQITPMNQVAHAESLTKRRLLCGPYKELDVPAPATVHARVPVAGGGASIEDLVTALSTKDDKREQEKLKLGLARTNGVNMGGVGDMKTGAITTLAIPVPTAGYIECCGKKTKEEKIISYGQLLNSNNKARPPGDQRSLFRDMELHDDVLLKNAVAGNYSQKVEYDLDKPSGQVQFKNFWSADQDSIVRMAEEKQRHEAAEAVDELETNRGAKRAYIETVNISLSSLDGIRGAMANYLAATEAKYNCTIPGSIPFLVQFGKYVFDWTLEAKTIKWFKNENDDEEKRQIILCLHGICDSLMCGFASSAEEFTTASLLRKNTTDNMSKEDFETALMAAAAEFDDLKKLRIRNKPLDFKSRYFSSKAAAAQKKLRAAGQAPAARVANGDRVQPTPAKKQYTGAVAAPANAWVNSGWSEEAASFADARRSAPKFDPEVGKKKGSLICKPTFACALAPDLAKKYCANLLVLGRFCDAKGCKKRHAPLYRFQADEKIEQYEYVLANKENVCFNKNDVPKNLPDKFAHLIRAPGQGAN